LIGLRRVWFIHNRYLQCFFLSDKFRIQLDEVKSQTTRDFVPITAQYSLFHLIPPIEEQTEIVRRVESLFAYADRLEVHYATARAQVDKLTSATLAKAFRGELVQQNSSDEPASRLLARIKLARAENEAIPKPKRGRKTATKTVATNKGNAMLQRKDIQPTHLSEILKERGSLSPELLWSVSQLQIDDFYDQLKEEEASGLLRESSDTSSSVRHLEAI
jgi:type I restriction enzyme S subunit